MTAGIYIIENLVSDKVYVGSAKSLRNRRATHWYDLRHNQHHSRKMQRAWNKYGEAAFSFRPLFFCSKENLVFFEQRALNHFDSVTHGFNNLRLARSSLGYRHTPETLAKLRVVAAARPPFSAEVRARIGLAMRGVKRGPMPESTKAKLRVAKLGVATRTGAVLSAETRAKISAARLGDRWSEERKRRYSIARTGEKRPPVSEAQKQKQSATMKGRPSAQRGRTRTPEQRARMSIAALCRVDRRPPNMEI